MRICNGLKTVSSISGVGKTRQIRAKNKNRQRLKNGHVIDIVGVHYNAVDKEIWLFL